MEVTSQNSSFIGQEHFMEREKRQSGFTLVELMVAMCISGVLLAVMVFAFTAQTRTYNAQEEISTLQEDLRSALSLMSNEARMATYNPTGGSNAKVITAASNEFRFSMDLDANGKTTGANEDVRYGINTNNSLGRDTSGDTKTGLQPMAENIEQLAFEYLVDGSWVASTTEIKKIRAVKICILGRTTRKTSTVKDNSVFNPPLATTPSPAWTPSTPDGYQRRMLSVVVKLRNQQG
jgi:type IV pilus assembly protein PilW